MRTRVVLSILALGLLLPACSTMKVSSTSAPGAGQKLEQFHTYAWLPAPENQVVHRSQFVTQTVMQATDAELASKGYRRVEPSANPDFLLGWIATTRQEMRIEDYYDYGWGPYGGVYGPEEVIPYTEGTLVVQAVDPSTNLILWRGEAQADLGSNPSGAEAQSKINEAVDKMFSKFPPKP